MLLWLTMVTISNFEIELNRKCVKLWVWVEKTPTALLCLYQGTLLMWKVRYIRPPSRNQISSMFNSFTSNCLICLQKSQPLRGGKKYKAFPLSVRDLCLRFERHYALKRRSTVQNLPLSVSVPWLLKNPPYRFIYTSDKVLHFTE